METATAKMSMRMTTTMMRHDPMERGTVGVVVEAWRWVEQQEEQERAWLLPSCDRFDFGMMLQVVARTPDLGVQAPCTERTRGSSS